MIYDLVQQDQYVHDDDWRDDDHWTEPEPPDDYYDREEPEPVHGYDDQFTKTERARVEAMRLVTMHGIPLVDQLEDVERIAKAILGPEHGVPDPYGPLREARTLACALVAKVGGEADPWKDLAEDDAAEVTVTKGELRALRNLLDEIVNPF